MHGQVIRFHISLWANEQLSAKIIYILQRLMVYYSYSYSVVAEVSYVYPSYVNILKFLKVSFYKIPLFVYPVS